MEELFDRASRVVVNIGDQCIDQVDRMVRFLRRDSLVSRCQIVASYDQIIPPIELHVRQAA